MAIDIPKEQRLTPAEARSHFVYEHSERTIRRWMTHGYKGIKLDGFKEGNLWTTSKEAIHRFLEELQRRQVDG
jgi:hypothetical protein